MSGWVSPCQACALEAARVELVKGSHEGIFALLHCSTQLLYAFGFSFSFVILDCNKARHSASDTIAPYVLIIDQSSFKSARDTRVDHPS